MLPSLHALPIPTNAPEYFGLDENSSGKLEDFLSNEEMNDLRLTNKASRRDTATLILGDWRRDEEGVPKGPGQWDDVAWTASFTRGRDATGTRVQYVATLDDYKAIRGNESGVELGIPFTIGNEDVQFARYEDAEFPFAGSSLKLNIPEWNLSGEYEFEYGAQSIRYISTVDVEEDGSRVFSIRIRIALQSADPKVYVSFGFSCRVNELEQYDQGGGGDDEDVDDDEDQVVYERDDVTNTARWFLVAVTIYRS